MRVRFCLGLSASVALLAATGCAQSQNVVRGQSPIVETPIVEGPVVEIPVAGAPAVPPPPVTGPLIGTAPGYGERPHFKNPRHDFKPFHGHYSQRFGYDDGAYDGTEQYYANHRKVVYDVGGGAAGCPACNGGMSCPAGGCQHCGYGCGCQACPDHYATYSYNGHFGHGGWPRNLVYPSPVVPAGMVQYPYYTLRGPTDFFMK